MLTLLEQGAPPVYGIRIISLKIRQESLAFLFGSHGSGQVLQIAAICLGQRIVPEGAIEEGPARSVDGITRGLKGTLQRSPVKLLDWRQVGQGITFQVFDQRITGQADQVRVSAGFCPDEIVDVVTVRPC